MKKVIMAALTVLIMTGCASSNPSPIKTVAPQPAETQSVAKKARLDVKKTVSNLLDYCEKWASAYEANLGKDPVEAFEECVQLTSDNMNRQAQERIEGGKASPADFPFTQ